MPNRLQVGFLVSFFLTLFSLIFLARWAKLRLKAAGYDISELILIGLPREPVEHVVDQAQSSLFQTMSDWALPELLALLLAFATSVFIYVKFAFSKISKSTVVTRHHSCSSCLSLRTQARSGLTDMARVPLGRED